MIRFYPSDRDDREQSQLSYGHRPAIVSDQKDCHISQGACCTGSFHADFDFAPKIYYLGSFLNDWNDEMDMTRRSLSDRRG